MKRRSLAGFEAPIDSTSNTQSAYGAGATLFTVLATTAVFDDEITYQYDANDRLNWEKFGQIGWAIETTTLYSYDNPGIGGVDNNGTQLTRQATYSSDNEGGTGYTSNETTYTYNAEGRQLTALVDADGSQGEDPATLSQYGYNAEGLRVKLDEGGNVKLYLVDGNNPTGYAQVLEEMTTAHALLRSYTLGLDVVSQWDSNGLNYLLYDGHGSTRALLSAAAAVQQRYLYDAYGNMLSGTGYNGLTSSANAWTRLLYSGEQTDKGTGLQYLRARFYDPRTGRFPTSDPFAGNASDPQSFHKYTYTHGDPIRFGDPLGTFEGLAGLAINISIGATVGGMVSGAITAIGGGGWGDIGRSAFRGALSGAVGGALGYGAGSLIGYAASGAGASLFLTGILEIIGGSVVAGAGVGMLDAYLDNRDIAQGAVEGAIFGLIMSPIYGIAAGATFRFAGQSGPGVETGVGRKLLRSIWEDRESFSLSREFFKRWRSAFGRNHDWSMEHMILKQRWYRNGTGRMAKLLQGIGDSGLNLVPVPRGFNTWLYNHPAASAIFNYGFYPTAFAGEYLLYQLASQLGETIANTIVGSDNE